MKKKAVIVQDGNDDAPVEKAVLAQAILNISTAFTKLLRSGLNQKAIVCLVHDSCGVGKPDVRAVLESLEDLAHDYTMPPRRTK